MGEQPQRGWSATADPAAAVGLALAVLALLTAGLPGVGLVLGLAAVVAGQRSRARARAAEQEPHRIAAVAVLLGILGVLLGGAFTGVLVAALLATG